MIDWKHFHELKMQMDNEMFNYLIPEYLSLEYLIEFCSSFTLIWFMWI